MKRNLVVGVAALAAMFGSGCATQPQEQLPPVVTPTGRPEVTIHGVSPARVASEIVTACAVTLHGTVTKADQGEVICSDLPSMGLGEAMWYSLNLPSVGGRSTDVATFRLLDVGSSVRVLAGRTGTTYNDFGGHLATTDWQRSIQNFSRCLRR